MSTTEHGHQGPRPEATAGEEHVTVETATREETCPSEHDAQIHDSVARVTAPRPEWAEVARWAAERAQGSGR